MRSLKKRISTKRNTRRRYSRKKSIRIPDSERRSLLNDQEFIYRKELLKYSPEFKNDNESFELLLYTIIKNEFLPKKIYDESEPEGQMKFVIAKLTNLLKRHKAFCHFFSFYHIEDFNIQKIATVIKYQFFEKNKYVYLENDSSTHFYFIIKGKVSFRRKIMRLNKIEYLEKIVLDDNNYFGAWDVVYERKRKLSCFCVTDCHLMSINKETLKDFLEEKMIKGESDKKSFLLKFFNSYLNIPLIKLERFLQNSIETLFYNRNDIIYREGDKNKYLYIIYNGEANLVKNLNIGDFSLLPKFNQSIEKLQEKAKKIDYTTILKSVKENNLDKNAILLDMSLNKVNYQVVSKFIKGSIGGLEIVTGNTEFKYSLISNNDFTTILKVNLLRLDDEHLKTFMQNLLPIFLQYEKKIHIQIKYIKYIDNYILPRSCQKFKDQSIENINNDNKNLDDSLNISIDADDNDEKFKEIIHKIDEKFDINEAGFIKMNDYNLKLHKQKNIIKDQLKNNKRNEKKIENYINQYIDEQNSTIKYSSVKFLNESNDNFFQINDKINTSYKNYNRIISSAKNRKTSIKNWRFSIYETPNLNNIKNKAFYPLNISKKRGNSSDNRKLKRKISKREYFRKLQEITEKVVRKARGQKDYSEMDINSIFKHKLILFKSFMGTKQKHHILKTKKSGNFIKEIFLLKKKSLNEPKTQRKLRLLSSDKNDNSNLYKNTYSGKKIGNLYEILKKGKIELNFENDDYVKVVNNKYIKDLFRENLKNKNEIVNTKSFINTPKDKRKLKLNIKSEGNIKKNKELRMVYYDTGQFDMPLVSHFSP